MLRLFLFLSAFLFLGAVSCQPMQLSSLDEEGFDYEKFDFQSLGDLSAEFESDKLDIVFILDTSPKMKGFYQENPVKTDFLSHFKSYDWRFAYTDMSVDPSAFNRDDEGVGFSQVEAEEDSSCGFFSGLLLTVTGVFFSGPELTGLGLGHLSGCGEYVLDVFEGEDPADSFANGVFLPFEKEGEKIENLPYLTKANKDFIQIFDHSTRLGHLQNGQGSYNAPLEKNTEAYPFLSLLLSLSQKQAQEGQAEGQEDTQDETSEDKREAGFFREDSAVVYVLLTGEDIKMEVSTEPLKESLKHLFGPENRLKVILATFNENSSLFCRLKPGQAQELSLSPKLKQLAEDMDWPVLDLCSKKLDEELYSEISASLSPLSLSLSLTTPSLEEKEEEM